MSNRTDLARLFTDNPGVWLTRSQIVEVGGDEATRRVRELRDRGMDIEGDVKRGYRYREQGKAQDDWTCTKCGAPAVYPLQPSTDTDNRWRLGRCGTCGKDGMIFQHTKKPLPATTGMVSRERQPDDAIPEPEPLPGLDPLHPLAKPTDWSDTG